MSKKKVLVFGSGISGIGACGLLERVEKEVILYDGNASLDAGKIKEQLGTDSSVEVVLGELSEKI
ncbi:MAG: UDP-N-acetylmuramoyl-L-alanine--D-glutamate ligase, partial [Tyzzerella sp.]|nr:UDP-N-acetylmuramoyl-L-alanine--D-glutamate ligase [Tyzzerella sp.]